jgi:hypothetical protein
LSWRKRGLLLTPPLELEWARSHAALPISFRSADGSWWLYFSSRDGDGRASVGRVRLKRDGDSLRAGEVDPQRVLEPGALGTFDDSGVTCSCLVESDGALLMFYTGWTRGVSVPFYLYAGVAVSEDGGARFHRLSNAPLLERSEVDPYLTASPEVVVEDSRWRMWYVSGTGWEAGDPPRHRYHLKYAESPDGLSWDRDGRVCVDYRDDSEYAFGRPCVLHEGARWRMWYCFRGERYRAGYAESQDGLAWERLDHEAGLDPSPGEWDGEMIAYPHVRDIDGSRYLLYNGNGYGATGIGYAEWES